MIDSQTKQFQDGIPHSNLRLVVCNFIIHQGNLEIYFLNLMKSYQFTYKCNSYEQCRISKVIYTAADAPEILTTGGSDDMTVNMSTQNTTSCSKTEKVRVVSSMYILILFLII